MFDYHNGSLIWKVSNSNRVKVGDIAGRRDAMGYVAVGINGKRYLAHRLVWIMHHGSIGDVQIDHINHERDDNRIENLRLVSHKENSQNQKTRSNNLSGFGNISYDKRKKGWVVRITVGERYIYGGKYDTIEEALSAKFFLIGEFGYHPNHGQS